MTIAELTEATQLVARYRRLVGLQRKGTIEEFKEVCARLLALGVVLDG